jgi:exodeoxyribonuclease VII large subunit
VRLALVGEFPTPIWVIGEVTGLRRTSGGAVFFRLADPDDAEASLDVGARGRMMLEIDRVLADSGLGGLRDGIGVRVKGTVELASRNSAIRLGLLAVDPTFTVGKLALERDELIRRMTADGSLHANRALPVPLVPLRLGLVTSRGSAAHADFTDQLRRSGYRFSVHTAHTTVQGENAPTRVAAALARLSAEPVDMIALVRGGGSKLDLSIFDNETVARAVAGASLPVITGIGHEVDRTIADEAASIAEKTPSAAGEWLVARVKDFAGRLDTARHLIRREAQVALHRHRSLLDTTAGGISSGVAALARQRDHLGSLRSEIAGSARRAITRHGQVLEGLRDWFSAVDPDSTLTRGFAIVATAEGSVVKSVSQVSTGDRLSIRLADGTVRVVVEGT